MKCCSNDLKRCADDELIARKYICGTCKHIYKLCSICRRNISPITPKKIHFHFVKAHGNGQMIRYVYDVMLVIGERTYISINHIIEVFPYIILLSINNFKHEFAKKIMEVIENNSDYVYRFGDFYPSNDPIIGRQLINLFTRTSYSCVLCGMNYDCFMPNVHLVSSHITSAHLNKIEFGVN